MRVAMLLIASVLLASLARPQDTELIPKIYLAPKYVAPRDAPSNTTVAGRDERGDRLIVTGRALDQGRPVAGVSIYAFHADADGLYTRDGRNSDENARLFATLRRTLRAAIATRRFVRAVTTAWRPTCIMS